MRGPSNVAQLAAALRIAPAARALYLARLQLGLSVRWLILRRDDEGLASD